MTEQTPRARVPAARAILAVGLVVWLVVGLVVGSLLAAGCRGAEYDEVPGWMPKAFQGDDADESRQAFEAELADATARYDYTGIEPSKIAHGRTLSETYCGGRSFRRYVIDGREATIDTHEALQSGRSSTGRTTKIPYFYDPNNRFVVVRQIFKVEDRWEVIVEEWVLLPPGEKCRRVFRGTLAAGEVSGAEDMLSSQAPESR